MTTLDLIQNIESASYSTLPIYRAKIARMQNEGEMPEGLSELLGKKINRREVQLAVTGVFAEELSKAVNAAPILKRMEEAKERESISGSDHLALLHAWKLRQAEVRT
jgi:hypothetical protein